jgi:hypothetical protein
MPASCEINKSNASDSDHRRPLSSSLRGFHANNGFASDRNNTRNRSIGNIIILCTSFSILGLSSNIVPAISNIPPEATRVVPNANAFVYTDEVGIARDDTRIELHWLRALLFVGNGVVLHRRAATLSATRRSEECETKRRQDQSSSSYLKAPSAPKASLPFPCP